MTRPFQVRTALYLASGLLACGDSPAEPTETIMAVEVTSAIDTLIAVGGTAQLAATAHDADGAPVSGVSFAWTSADASVVSVTPAGVATGVAAGRTTITTTADGSDVSGTLPLRVVDVDLAAIGQLSADAYAAALVNALSPDAAAATEAWNACGAAAGDGNLIAVVDCVTTLDAEAASAGDPTDRAALAALTLFSDQIGRELGQ